MAEITIALDAGHGGSDPGATYQGRSEKDDTLRLTKAVGKILEENGINVFYTRTTDEYETPFKKAMDANNAGADYFVSIHRNSSDKPNQYCGVESLVYNDSGIKAVMARNINEELAQVGFNNLGVDERPNLVVLKRTKMPAVLVEVGFINCDKDNELFDNDFDAIARAIADGILKTLYPDDVTKYEDDTTSSTTSSVNSNIYQSNSDYDFMNYMARRDDDDSQMPQDDDSMKWKYREDDDSNWQNPQDDSNWQNPQDDSMNWNRYQQNNTEWDPYNMNWTSGPAIGDNNNQNSNNTMTNPTTNNNVTRNSEEEETDKLYRVQVGAYRNKDNADRMLNSLLVEGFPAFIIMDDGLYKVQVGAFRYLANAIKMEQKLRRFRYSTYIVFA